MRRAILGVRWFHKYLVEKWHFGTADGRVGRGVNGSGVGTGTSGADTREEGGRGKYDRGTIAAEFFIGASAAFACCDLCRQCHCRIKEKRKGAKKKEACDDLPLTRVPSMIHPRTPASIPPVFLLPPRVRRCTRPLIRTAADTGRPLGGRSCRGTMRSIASPYSRATTVVCRGGNDRIAVYSPPTRSPGRPLPHGEVG